jgi:hypothetical protein
MEMTTTEEASERAFNAAEAGIEEMLAKDLDSIIGGDTFSIGDLDAVVDVAESSDFESFIKNNDTATIQLSGGTGTEITIKWTLDQVDYDSSSNVCDQDPAGLIIEKWTDNAGTIEVSRLGKDAFGCPSGDIGFDSTGVGTTAPYLSSYTLTIDPANDIYVRVRPVFNDTTIAVSGTNLPTQQHEFTSTATVGGTGESRAIEVVRTIPDLPGIFDYVLFSGTAINKP